MTVTLRSYKLEKSQGNMCRTKKVSSSNNKNKKKLPRRVNSKLSKKKASKKTMTTANSRTLELW